MGAKCKYFCELGWQRAAITDGMGGFLKSGATGGRDSAVIYDNLLPACFLPLECGNNCTDAVNTALYTCLDYVDSIDSTQKILCQSAIAAATSICGPHNFTICVQPITSKFIAIADKDYGNISSLVIAVGEKTSTFQLDIVLLAGIGNSSVMQAQDNFMTNLLLSLLKDRLTHGRLYIQNITIVPLATRKRYASQKIDVTFLLVANGSELEDTMSDILSYSSSQLAIDSGLVVSLYIPPTSAPTAPVHKPHNKLSHGAIAGIVVGVVVAVTLIATAAVVFIRYKTKQNSKVNASAHEIPMDNINGGDVEQMQPPFPM